jgi:hypothetical protein
MGFSEEVLMREAVRLSSAVYTPIPYFFSVTWKQYCIIIDEVTEMNKEIKHGGRK